MTNSDPRLSAATVDVPESRKLSFLLTLRDVMRTAYSRGDDRLMSVWQRDLMAIEWAIQKLESSSAVERLAVNEHVAGSIPASPAIAMGAKCSGSTSVSKTDRDGSIPSASAIPDVAQSVGVQAALYFDVEDYVRDYEFRGEGGDYKPTEAEQEVLIDAIHGVLAALFDKPAKPPAATVDLHCLQCGATDDVGILCQRCRKPLSRCSAGNEDVRWAVNYLLEQIAAKFEAWETFDLFRSEAASTVRSFKHDLSSVPPQEARK